jgi:nudix-type nucleoside diphosphatase (YffH/AdpP family)
MPTEITKLETIHSGWARFLVATVRLGNGQTARREIEDHGSAACVLPYNPARRTAILVKQFRAPVFLATHQLETLEAIAGIIEESDPMDCARREALEEAGIRIGSLEPVVTGWTMPGLSTEQMHLFLAEYHDTDRVGQGGGLVHDQENITPVEMRLAMLAAMADAGTLCDVKTLLLVQTLRLRRGELFA